MAFAAATIAIVALAVSWLIRRFDPRLFATSRLAVLAVGVALLMIAPGFSGRPESVGESVAVAGFLAMVPGLFFDWRFRNETAG